MPAIAGYAHNKDSGKQIHRWLFAGERFHYKMDASDGCENTFRPSPTLVGATLADGSTVDSICGTGTFREWRVGTRRDGVSGTRVMRSEGINLFPDGAPKLDDLVWEDLNLGPDWDKDIRTARNTIAKVRFGVLFFCVPPFACVACVVRRTVSVLQLMRNMTNPVTTTHASPSLAVDRKKRNSGYNAWLSRVLGHVV